MHNKKEADTESVLVSLYSLLQITRAYGDNNTSVFSLEMGVMIDKMIEETEKLRFHYELLEPLIMHNHSNNILQLLENLYDKSKD